MASHAQGSRVGAAQEHGGCSPERNVTRLRLGAAERVGPDDCRARLRHRPGLEILAAIRVRSAEPRACCSDAVYRILADLEYRHQLWAVPAARSARSMGLARLQGR